MSDDRDALLEQLRAIRKDLTYAQAKLTDALELVARLPAPPAPNGADCPLCGLRLPAHRLADHQANVHGLDPASR